MLYLILAGAMLSVAAGGIPVSTRPLAFMVSLILTWLISVPVIHALASGCFVLDGGQRLSLGEIARGSLRSMPPALWAGFLATLLVLLGSLALLIGGLFGWALGLWVLVVAIIENRKGRQAADRAVQLAGASGILWGLGATMVAIFLSSYLVLLAQQLVGSAALLAYPPLAAMIAIPLVVSAVLERRA